MRLHAIIGRAALLGALLALTVPALSQRAGRLAAFGRLEAGLWQLRDLDAPRARHAPVCLGDPTAFLQLRHRSTACSRLVVAQDGRSGTVHYTCGASGYGQTSFRVETPRLVQIDTQGIAGNTPFAHRFEARRVGACR